MNKTHYALLLATLLLGGCGLFTEERDRQAPLLPEPPQTSRTLTYPVERVDLIEKIEGSAVVTPVRETSLYFVQRGRLQLLKVEPDDEVKADDVLAQLEIGELQHQLDLTRVDLQIAKVKLEEQNVLGSVFDIKTQELAIARHEINAAFLSGRIEAGTIRAPYDGIVKRVQITVSDPIEEYEPIIEMLDPTELELQMRISENDFYLIEAKQKAMVEIGGDTWAPAVVVQTTHKNPRFDASIRREEFVVHLELEAKNTELRLNERKQTYVIMSTQTNTLVIPKAGLREFRDRTYVRVLEGEVRREVDVKVGIRTDVEVEILEGLEEGELVIGK